MLALAACWLQRWAFFGAVALHLWRHTWAPQGIHTLPQLAAASVRMHRCAHTRSPSPTLLSPGMGVYGGGSFADRGSSGDEDSDARGSGSSGDGGGDSDSSFHSRSRGPWPVAAIPRPDERVEDVAAAVPAPAADEEEGGPQPRWWRRSACCAGGGGVVARARPAVPGWLKLHLMQLRLMKVGGWVGVVV